MIERIKYHTNSVYEESEEIRKSTHLEAVLKFGREVAPKDRAKVKNRLNTDNSGDLSYYLKGNENIRIIDPEFLGWSEYSRTSRSMDMDLTIRQHWLGFGLGITLKARVENGIMPEQNMINIEALNEYILTGKRTGQRGGEKWEPYENEPVLAHSSQEA